MAVSATPPVLSPTSNPGAGSLFRSDPLYTSPAESPRLTSSLINSFISSGGGGGGGNGNGTSGNNECKVVEVHGVKVASFNVDGQELICLPQVFDLFLKHLVGGLHTVYTKLKRLDICPVVCTVEQVRILRGLGAIQPGVNRCKLITRKDFEALYNDCTNASSRPGRPPKRSLGVAMQESSRLLPHSVHGLLSPGLLSSMSPGGLTAAAMAEAMKLQKMKLMAMNNLHGAGSQNGTESENDELNSNAGGSESSWDKEKLQSPPSSGAAHGLGHAGLSGQHGLSSSHLSSLQQNHLLANRLDLPFMMMPHPLLPVSLPPASVAMAMNQMNHLNTIANMAAAAQMHSPLSRAGASVIKSDPRSLWQECVQDSPSPAPSMEEGPRPGSQPSSHPSSSASSSPAPHQHTPDRLVMNPVDGGLGEREAGINMKKMFKEKDEAQLALPMMKPGFEKMPLGGQTLPPGFPAPFLFADGLNSVETLLTNIQGLLKVAVDNARVQEKQVQQERKELKMELYREREMRESLERQLTSELHSRATIQKRLKKEKKAKRKLQEALEFESKRREQVEQALKTATSPENLCMSLNEAVIPEVEPERNGSQQENSAVQENRPYTKPPIMY
ncbi:dachshund homolog 2-like isoform X1 [Salvelinus namaycush]|uniref:Dachshund homolog 2-like isoform X1 n=1 Tax=Salvelinus namaycush TaxID=8040 RepID=A0A8U1BYL2_SALNM|nr:dachshund homolog 2-like isoform X1 [Salvelinus namaycush]